MKLSSFLLILVLISAANAADKHSDRVAVVANTRGCVAFWDFVKREPDHLLTRSVFSTQTQVIPAK